MVPSAYIRQLPTAVTPVPKGVTPAFRDTFPHTDT